MPATVTLSSTTLAEGVNAASGRIKVASTAGMLAGTRLYIGGELMAVIRIEVDPWVSVTRGVDGSKASAHASEETIYIGRADQFYSTAPVGRPDAAILVSPYIDVVAGRVYFAQGDASATSSRWWQEESVTHGAGPLGVRTTTFDPTSST